MIKEEARLTLNPKIYQRNIYTAHNTEAECFEAGKKIQLEHDNEAIPIITKQAQKDERKKFIEWLETRPNVSQGTVLLLRIEPGEIEALKDPSQEGV